MEQATSSPKVYRFGPFEVLVSTGELRKDGERIKLQGQPAQILVMLLRANGEVVPRESLRHALWSSDTFVDFEHSLNTAVKKLRQALGDDADQPKYIETVPRVGYRLRLPAEADNTASAIASPAAAAADRRRARGLWIATGAIVLAIAVAAFVVHALTASHELRITDTRQLTFHGGDWELTELASDGKRVYYFKDADPRLFSVPVAGGEETSFPTRFKEAFVLDISPDGANLLVKEFHNQAGTFKGPVWLQPTEGGTARPLDIQADYRAAAWSPDGKTIAFGNGNTIFLTSDEGATVRPSIKTPGDVVWIRWSPDGKRLRFTVVDTKTDVAAIWEATPNGTAKPVQFPLPNQGLTQQGSWTRDGRYFLFQSFSSGRPQFWISEEGGAKWGARKPVQLTSTSPILCAQPSPTSDDIFVVEDQAFTTTYRFDPIHEVVAPYLSDRSLEDPAFSPDGKWLTYSDERQERAVIWRSKIDGTAAIQLTDAKLYARFPHFSRDGKLIAFMGKPLDQPWRIHWVSVDGGAVHAIKAPVASQADVNWMPDGETILFGQTPWYVADPNTPRAIYTYNLRTEAWQKVPNTDGWFSPRISPDGKSFLAVTADESKLGLYDFATANWRILLEPKQRVGAPYWSPDGTDVYANVHDPNSGFENKGVVVRIHLRDGKARTLFEFSQYFGNAACNSWGLAPDGQLTVSCWHASANIYALQYEK